MFTTLLWMGAGGISAEMFWYIISNKQYMTFTWCGVLGIIGGYIRGTSGTDVLTYIRSYS